MNDRHVAINGRELDASTPHFENLYTFSGPPREDHYSGHVNSYVSPAVRTPHQWPLFFPDENAEYAVPRHQYFVCGDNTMNSYDSRYWGCLSGGPRRGQVRFCLLADFAPLRLGRAYDGNTPFHGAAVPALARLERGAARDGAAAAGPAHRSMNSAICSPLRRSARSLKPTRHWSTALAPARTRDEIEREHGALGRGRQPAAACPTRTGRCARTSRRLLVAVTVIFALHHVLPAAHQDPDQLAAADALRDHISGPARPTPTSRFPGRLQRFVPILDPRRFLLPCHRARRGRPRGSGSRPSWSCPLSRNSGSRLATSGTRFGSRRNGSKTGCRSADSFRAGEDIIKLKSGGGRSFARRSGHLQFPASQARRDLCF